MNILAIDTSSTRLCVGLMNHKGKVLEYNLESEKRHMELLLPTIKKALRDLKLSLCEIDYLAVGLGPGSFTGLRIGLATIKGFAAALKKPVVGLPGLDVIARNALGQENKIICPIIDAKRNLVFAALYKAESKKLKRISTYLLISVEELLKKIGPRRSVVFLGDGIPLYRRMLEKKLRDAVFLRQDLWYPRGQKLIELARELIEKGKAGDAKKINPIYLYPKECQVRKD